MKNLFFREVKRNSKSFCLWLVILVAVNAFMFVAFESVAETATNTEAMLSQYPEAFIKAMSLDKFDMTNILHYYASRSYILFMLFGSIYSVMLSACILSKEEADRSIEFLISKPITRNEIVGAKYLCVTMYVFLFNLLFSISNFLFMQVFKMDSFDLEPFLLVSVGGFFIHMIFASVGYLMSVFITKTKTIISVSFGIIFITYFFNILASVEEKMSYLKYLSPFSYYGAEDMVINSTLNLLYLIITIIIITLSVGLTYLFYSKKDITA